MTIQKLNDTAYNKLDGLRCSDLKHFLVSPAHYLHNLKHPMKQTKAMRIGTIVHKLLLEPETIGEIAVFTEAKTEAAKAWHVFKYAVEQNNKIPVFKEEMDTAKKVVECVTETKPWIMDRIDSAQTELAATASICGVHCKSKADGWVQSEGLLFDVKTFGDNVANFKRNVYGFGYNVQAAFYSDIFIENEKDVKKFEFLVIETKPPYEARVVELSTRIMTEGRDKYLDKLPDFLQCLKNNYWPGYDNTTLIID